MSAFIRYRLAAIKKHNQEKANGLVFYVDGSPQAPVILQQQEEEGGVWTEVPIFIIDEEDTG